MLCKVLCTLHKDMLSVVYTTQDCDNYFVHQPLKRVFFNRINSLAKGVAQAKVMSPRRPHFSPFNGSKLNCHRRSGTGKFSYSSASIPQRHNFSWGNPINWAIHVLTVNWTVIRGAATSNLAIPVPELFWRLLPATPLFPCSSIGWTTVFCIGVHYTRMCWVWGSH